MTTHSSVLAWEIPSTVADINLNLIQDLQFSSVAQSCPTLCNPMNCSTPGLPVHRQLPSLPKFMSIESVMPPNHLILCCPLLLLPSIFPRIRVFSNKVSPSHQVAKVLEFQGSFTVGVRKEIFQ